MVHCLLAEIRRPLRAAVEHRQREDLRLPLVLVRHHQRHHRNPDGVQVGRVESGFISHIKLLIFFSNGVLVTYV
jgi:hypothetical protein